MANPRAGRAANSSRGYHWDFLMSDWDSDSSGLSSPPASPPPCLPTPPPSQDAGESRAEHCQDDVAPARKRRRVGPKERTTQHLDLSQYAPISRSEQQSQIDLLTKTIHQHRKIVVVAGAGISTSAGSTPPNPQPTCSLISKLTLYSSRLSVYGRAVQGPAEKTQPEGFWEASFRRGCLPG